MQFAALAPHSLSFLVPLPSSFTLLFRLGNFLLFILPHPEKSADLHGPQPCSGSVVRGKGESEEEQREE